jgi:hypothetical protein
MPELQAPTGSQAPLAKRALRLLKLIAVPNRRPTPVSEKPSARPRAGFRERYNEIEAYRAALVARLTSLGETAQRHPGCKRAFTLLNATFRRSKLAQRLAILNAAAWLIDVLEKLTSIT